MKQIGILDSGVFSDNTGRLSSPRIYEVIRELEVKGLLTISDITYVRSQGTDLLQDEPEGLREIRETERWHVEQNRVENTAEAFKVREIENQKQVIFDNTEIIVILMRPSKQRNQLIRDAVASGKRVIVYPPYFTDNMELQELRDALPEETEERVILWLPYRYSLACTEILQRFDQKQIGAIALTIKCSSYPKKQFITEFCSPFLDVMLQITGKMLTMQLTHQLSSGSPIYNIQGIHPDSVLSSILLTTLGGSLQNMEAGSMVVYGRQMEHIETRNTFTGIIYRSAEKYHESTEVSHDPSSSSLTGYRTLMMNCLSDDWANDLIKPSLHNCDDLQKLLDALLNVELSINRPKMEKIRLI
ncbi:hypothetical protein F4212_01015 [Candidatus Poribacteria bacterium]|nr:hypothetical protein [Candidatus Poribacteria bacterium]